MADGQAREYIAFDLETTGLVASRERIVEIGAVRFDASGRELGRFEQLVNPERPMPPAAFGIHGISDADLIGAPLAAQILPEFLEFLGDPANTSLMAHNAAFDCGFLGLEFGLLGLPMPSHEVIDTLALARKRMPRLHSHRLDTLARLLRLDPHGPHRALADSLRVKDLWLWLSSNESVPDEPLVSYSIGPVAATPNGWGPLAEAIAGRLRVRMEYGGGTRGSAPREVTPVRFDHRGGVAYLVAFCHLDAFEKSFRLDRVLRYEVVR